MAQPPTKGHETILLVEDEPAIRELMARRLTRLGYTVLVAPTGQHALDVAEQHIGPIHLLLADVVMPRMDGFTLDAKLSASLPELKVLFITGESGSSVSVRGGLKESGRPFLLKPFTPDELELKIREVLDIPTD